MKLQTIGLWMAWLAIGAIGIAFAFPGALRVFMPCSDRCTFQEIASALPGNETHELQYEPLPEVSVEKENNNIVSILKALESDSTIVLDGGDNASAEPDWSGIFGTEIGSASTGGLGTVGSGVGGGGSGYGAGVGSIGSIGNQVSGMSSQSNGKAMVKPKLKTGTATLVPNSEGPPSEVTSEPDSPGDEFAAEFDSLLDEVDRKLASLPLANIAFNTPETIPLGDSKTIELLVSLQEAGEELRQAIRTEGPIETARVKVSPYLEASLTGVGFRIESVTPSKQMLSRAQRTQWRWNIEPTKADSLELTLTLSAFFSVNGEQRTRAIRTFEQIIAVDVPISHRVSQFVSANQEWLFTLLVFPIAGWFYRRYGRRRKPPSGDNERAVRRAA